jgi:hypothetical protein
MANGRYLEAEVKQNPGHMGAVQPESRTTVLATRDRLEWWVATLAALLGEPLYSKVIDLSSWDSSDDGDGPHIQERFGG